MYQQTHIAKFDSKELDLKVIYTLTCKVTRNMYFITRSKFSIAHPEFILIDIAELILN